ncbi:MAG: Chemotaxis protein CheA [Firmicutes bacterium ADurb.Bin193]|nr:MAG: Chemotaxis protein CheA [Firmicutes bacterium ADurb.Bin193]
MQNNIDNQSMIELYLLETNQLIEQLEMIIIRCEKDMLIDTEDVNNIFRIMHTIKGSSAMMGFNGIANLAHSVEDLFSFIREHGDLNYDFNELFGLMLDFIDYIKDEEHRIEKGEVPGAEPAEIAAKTNAMLGHIQNSAAKLDITSEKSIGNEQYYCLNASFEPDAQMENVRSHLLLYSLGDGTAKIISTIPQDLDTDESAGLIRKHGLFVCFSSSDKQENIEKTISETLFLKSYKLVPVSKCPKDITEVFDDKNASQKASGAEKIRSEGQQNYISVHSDKLNALMDIVGEMVISEAMLTNNPDLEGLKLENFDKSARRFRKLLNELRDIVVDIRMLPLSIIFQKMQRLIRDMSKKLGKDIEFVMSGEDTLVDKSTIDILSEPVMHLIRNAADHGIEKPSERKMVGKPKSGQIVLKAWQNSSDAFVEVSDDGRGLDKEAIYKKAFEKGLFKKSFEELMDKEIYDSVMLPGFSTNESVTEFSGRGVGLDVVKKYIESVGGSISLESQLGRGTTVLLRIPLTLLIINIMHVMVGHTKIAVPIRYILEVKKTDGSSVTVDGQGNEMIEIRGKSYPVIRLGRLFDIHSEQNLIEDGILVLVEADNKAVCLFADKPGGEQQIVVKPLPNYIKDTKWLCGCSIQNDDSLSLVLDVNQIVNSLGV